VLRLQTAPRFTALFRTTLKILSAGITTDLPFTEPLTQTVCISVTELCFSTEALITDLSAWTGALLTTAVYTVP